MSDILALLDDPGPGRQILHVDLETFSRADIKSTGADHYGRHESTEILIFAYAVGDGAPEVWIPHEGPPPAGLFAALEDPRALKMAHNAAFEMAVLSGVLGVVCPPEQWACTAVLARAAGLPGGLGPLSEVLRLGDQSKSREGRRLIQKFSTPKKPTKAAPGRVRILPTDDPVDFAAFVEYCRQDVRAEQAVFSRLRGLGFPAHEWAAWQVDQKINRRGLPIDLDFVDAVRRIDADRRADLLAEAELLTGLDNPNSVAKLRAWLAEEGVETASLTKNDVLDLVDAGQSDKVDRALRIRAELSKTSVKKFDALAKACGPHDNRLRGAFLFAGAGRTWRWAGQIFQPQNLPRGSFKTPEQTDVARRVIATGNADLAAAMYDGDVAGVLSGLVRTAIAPPPGRRLVVADYSSIETIMLAWAAQCGPLLDVFRAGRCAYREMAVDLFSVEYGEVDGTKRQYAKPVVLGCGYMLGATGLVEYAKQYRVDMGEDEALSAVRKYRGKYPEIVALWYDLQRAAEFVVRSEVGAERSVGVFDLSTKRTGDDVVFQIRLPSGRFLTYWRPRLEPSTFGGVNLTYEQVDGVTKKWGRVWTHPGKIVENIVQAISRDLLADLLVRRDAAGGEIVGHIHDEVIEIADEDDADATLREILDAMAQPPKWCTDAPLKGAGWTGTYYRKD